MKNFLLTLTLIKLLLFSFSSFADVSTNLTNDIIMSNADYFMNLWKTNPYDANIIECRARGGEDRIYKGDIFCFCGIKFDNLLRHQFCVNNQVQEQKPANYEYDKNVEIEKHRNRNRFRAK